MVLSALGDEPPNPTARWVSSPDERGTFNILSNCVLTLVLCVWTAIHLNIPAAKDVTKSGSRTKREGEDGEVEKETGPVESEVVGSFNWKKIKYVILALVMPEIVAAVAFTQWLEHRTLLKYINNETELGVGSKEARKKKRPADEEMAAARPSLDTASAAVQSNGDNVHPEDAEVEQTRPKTPVEELRADAQASDQADKEAQVERARRPRWTSAHCWYAIMGGFTVENVDPSYPFPFPDSCRPRLTLTSDGIRKLAKHHPDVFPAIRASEIADKSKSNELAKLIVCTQVLWFIINAVGRVAQALPLTVLELNTAAHCFCVFVTYAFWWHKPLDIVQPSVLTLTEEAARMVAYMTVRGQASMWFRRDEAVRHEASLYRRFKGYYGNDVFPSMETTGYDLYVITPESSPRLAFCVLEEEVERASGWVKAHLKTLPLSEDDAAASSHETSNSRLRIRDYDAMLELGRLANQYVQEVGDEAVEDDDNWKHTSFCQEWLIQAAPNYAFESIRVVAISSFGPSFVAACTIYALIHAAAWDGPFRSKVELYLWRMGVLAFVPLLYVTPGMHASMWRRSEGWRPVDDFFSAPQHTAAWALEDARSRGAVVARCALFVPWLLSWLCQVPKFFIKVLFSRVLISIWSAVALLAFFTGRMFLVVEAFIALPYAPDGAFVQPQWLAYLPHFG